MLLKYILAILFFSGFAVCQDFNVDKKYNYTANFIVTDQFKNIYIVNSSKLVKVNTQTNKVNTYNNIPGGQITTVDASDPFRIVVFYKDFNKVIFLNNNLSELGNPIELDKIGLFNVCAVCNSVNGGFWVFDQMLSQLVYVNKDLEISRKSIQLYDLINQNHSLNKVFMIEKNDYIYLGINGSEILLFDNYGTYIKTFPLAYNFSFQLNNDFLTYANNNNFCFYNIINYTEECYILPKQNYKQVLIENNNLFVLTEKEIIVYQFNKN